MMPKTFSPNFWLAPRESACSDLQTRVFLHGSAGSPDQSRLGFTITWAIATANCSAMLMGACWSDQFFEFAERAIEDFIGGSAGLSIVFTTLFLVSSLALAIAFGAVHLLTQPAPGLAKTIAAALISLCLSTGAGVLTGISILTPLPVTALLTLSLTSGWLASTSTPEMKTVATAAGLIAAGIVLVADYLVFHGIFAPERPLSLQLPLLLGHLVTTGISIVATLAVLEWNQRQMTVTPAVSAYAAPAIYHALLFSALIYLSFLLAALKRLFVGLRSN